MRVKTGSSLIAAVLVCASCGDGSGLGSSTVSPGRGTPYPFKAPPMGTVRTYGVTIIDNAGNTIQVGYSDTTVSVSASGEYTAAVTSTTGSSTIVDGTNYAVMTQSELYDTSGQEISYSFKNSSGADITCAYDPHAAGPDFPVKVGQTWDFQYVQSCDNSSPAITYRQQGSVVDVEPVIVPAGTFTALKLESTITWTNSAGTTRVETVTNWRDTKTLFSLKESITIAVSGNMPANGYAVSRTTELETIS